VVSLRSPSQIRAELFNAFYWIALAVLEQPVFDLSSEFHSKKINK